MRGLMVAVVVMGVLIAAGLTTVGLTITHRLLTVPPVPQDAVLDEPAGTRITGVTALGDRLALRLEGGGPDRVVVVDLRNGKVAGRAALAR
jgi:hypothetical protein